jgi:conjugal transfer/entry exclusion protein
MSIADDETRPHTKHKDCEYVKDRQRFFTTNLFKLIGVVYALAAPFFVWLTLTAFGHATEIALLKEKQSQLIEVKQTLDQINKTVTQIQIDMGKLQGATKL